jgi:hypothetical protein
MACGADSHRRVFSNHTFVWLSYTQTTAVVIAGREAAWVFIGGVFKVVMPDHVSAEHNPASGHDRALCARRVRSLVVWG